MILDYDKQAVFTKSFDIADIGNTTIRAANENGFEFYIATKTILGKTSILKFGPIMPDIEVLLDSFELSYQKIDFKEANIMKALNLYINDIKKKIVNLEEIIETELFDAFPDIINSFNLGE